MLQRLLENRLYVKAEKYKFHILSVTFLGYSFEGGQVRTDPEKKRAFADWPISTTHKQLQWFLGFASFYLQFIQNYSQVASPFTKFTSVKIPFY